MRAGKLLLALGGALILYAVICHTAHPPAPPPTTKPAPKPAPKEPDKPKKPHSPCPHCPSVVRSQAPSPTGKAPQLGGTVSPDGTTKTIEIPEDIKFKRNIASQGVGCCGFRSLEYCAQLQNVPELLDWPEHMRQDHVPGGACPEKVERLLQRYAPNEPHWQDTTKSHAVLRASIQSQRPCAIDYNGHDPHYRGGIAHCVTLVAFDQENDWAAILDNNFPELDQIVWMSIKELDRRWGGWAYGLLAQRPGYLSAQEKGEEWEFFADAQGMVNYGLERTRFAPGSYVILNGDKATTQEIIAALGPAMAPIIDPHVQVDSKIDLGDLKTLMLYVGGTLVIVYLVSHHTEK